MIFSNRRSPSPRGQCLESSIERLDLVIFGSDMEGFLLCRLHAP
jgi:hypothetical protein